MTSSRRSLPIFDLLLAVAVALAAPRNPAFVAFQQRAAAAGSSVAVKALVPAPVDARP